jgi:hypothetical protein
MDVSIVPKSVLPTFMRPLNILLLYSLVRFYRAQKDMTCRCELAKDTFECEFLFTNA